MVVNIRRRIEAWWKLCLVFGLERVVTFKSTKIIGLSVLEPEAFINLLSPKIVLVTSISTFNTCLHTFPFSAQLQLHEC